MTRYDKIPISKKTREGMSLNINDLTCIKRMFDLQDRVFEETLEELEGRLLKNLILELKPIIQDIVKCVVQEEMKEVKAMLKDHEARIICLEKKVENILQSA